MKIGKFKYLNLILIFLMSTTSYIYSDDKIKSVPLINLEELSPTFEEDKDELESVEDKDNVLINNDNIIVKTKDKKDNKIYINLKALDKITAKTSTIKLAVGEKKFFGPLEIKALKCQFSEKDDFVDTVAYIQVKDLSIKDNNQVFIFNGWTFASDPNLTPFDHAIYDLQLLNCFNV